MNTLSTHVLNTAEGRPAQGMSVTLFSVQDGTRTLVSTQTTDIDGRAKSLAPTSLAEGEYLLKFDTSGYFRNKEQECFYPYVEVLFSISTSNEHYHVPLLISPYGYSTYRGS